MRSHKPMHKLVPEHRLIPGGRKLLTFSIIICIEMGVSGAACATKVKAANGAPKALHLVRNALHPDATLNFPPLPKQINATKCEDINAEIAIEGGKDSVLSVFVDKWNSSAVPSNEVIEVTMTGAADVGETVTSISPDHNPAHTFSVIRIDSKPDDPPGTLRCKLELPVSSVYEGSSVSGVSNKDGELITYPYPAIVGKPPTPTDLNLARDGECGPVTATWNNPKGKAWNVKSGCLNLKVNGSTAALKLDPATSHSVSVYPDSNCSDLSEWGTTVTLNATPTGRCTQSQREGFVSCPLKLTPIQEDSEENNPSALSLFAGMTTAGASLAVGITFVVAVAVVAGTYYGVKKIYRQARGYSELPGTDLEAGEGITTKKPAVHNPRRSKRLREKTKVQMN